MTIGLRGDRLANRFTHPAAVIASLAVDCVGTVWLFSVPGNSIVCSRTVDV